jgi:hypothetical protein
VNVRWVPFLKVKAKAFVDQWLHIATEDASCRKIYTVWFRVGQPVFAGN